MAIDPRGGLSSLVSSEAENMYGMPQPALEQRAKVAGATMDAIVARKALEMKNRLKPRWMQRHNLTLTPLLRKTKKP